GFHRAQDARAFPVDIAERLGNGRLAVLLGYNGMRAQILVAKHEQEKRRIVTHGESRDLPSRLAVHDVHELVARSIAADLESSDMEAQGRGKRRIGPEGERSDARVQSVRADDKIDIARRGVSEADGHV